MPPVETAEPVIWTILALDAVFEEHVACWLCLADLGALRASCRRGRQVVDALLRHINWRAFAWVGWPVHGDPNDMLFHADVRLAQGSPVLAGLESRVPRWPQLGPTLAYRLRHHRHLPEAWPILADARVVRLLVVSNHTALLADVVQLCCDAALGSTRPGIKPDPAWLNQQRCIIGDILEDCEGRCAPALRRWLTPTDQSRLQRQLARARAWLTTAPAF